MKLCDLISKLNLFSPEDAQKIDVNMIAVCFNGTIKIFIHNTVELIGKDFNVVTPPTSKYIEIK